MRRAALLLFLLAILTLPSLTAAQNMRLARFQPGHWVVAAQSGFEFTSQFGDLYEVGDKPVTMLNLGVSAGAFVSPGFTIGGIISYQSVTVNGNNSNSAGIGPQLQYYFLGSSAWVPSLGAAFVYYSATGNVTLTSVQLRGGVDYMITDDVAIGAGLQYEAHSRKVGSSGSSVSGNVVHVNAKFSLFF